METLELLEALLTDYTGTLLLVSHDRQFLDNVVTSIIVFKGEGQLEESLGGYSDWQDYQQAIKQDSSAKDAPATNYKAQKALQALERKIEKLEEKQAALHESLCDSDLYEEKNASQLAKLQADLKKTETELGILWAQLSER